MPLSSLLSETWETIYQSAIVKLPRAVPSAVLHYTSPEGPHPFILDLPSRDYGQHKKGLSRRTIPVYVFVPPLGNLASAIPDQTLSPSEPARVALPVLLDFHGGGFFMGSCLEQAPFCALMARTLNCVVVSVDYRMAPVDKFPAAVHDAEDILNALIDVEAPGAKALEEAIQQRCLSAFKKSRSRSTSRAGRESATASKTPSAVPSRAPSPITDNEDSAHLKVADELSMQKVKTQPAPLPQRDPSPAPPATKPKLSKMRSTDSFRTRMKRAQKSTDSLRRYNRLTKSRSTSPAQPAPLVSLDRTRIAISGFSSGGNLALNAITNVPAGSPHADTAWPCPFPPDFAHPIPTLLYYPAVDLQQLPSERLLPAGMRKSEGWFARLSDNLAPSYCPRGMTAHWRASPGLANSVTDIHARARMLLVLPELDNLADQNEKWASKVAAEGRGGDLMVERYKGMTHGWTQFPISFLDEEQKRTRGEIFEKSVDFLRGAWFDGAREA